jgi:hypothetical protein
MPRSFGTTNAAPYATPPSVGAAGDTYFNTTSKTLYLSDGTQWIQVQGGGGAVTSLGPSAGQAILADRTTTTANTWFDWGSPITLPAASVPPGIGPITVLALVTGSANEFSQAQMLPQVRVAISMDNGATWSYGSAAQETPVGMNSLFINRTPVTHSHVLTGTPTAAVLVKAQVYSDKTSSVFNAGQLSWWLGTGAVGPQGPQGPAGPPGTDPTSFLASYFYGNLNTGGSALPASTYTQLSFTQIAATSFTLTVQEAALGYRNIVAGVAGRYLVNAVIGGYGSTGNVGRVDLRLDTKTAAGATKLSRQIVGEGVTSAYNNQASVTAVVDLLAGEYITLWINPAAAGFVVDYGGAYSYITVVPIGGPQGPVGPTGPDITAAQSSYFYATAAGPMSVQTLSPVTWGTTVIGNGFSGTAAIVAANTGRYRVAAQISGSNGAAASAYRICHIKHYSSGAVLKADRSVVNPATAANVWGTWFAEAILDMVAGDYVRIEIESDVAIALDQSGRNWLEITPVGGVKGDKGDPGALGTLAAASWLWASHSAPVPQIGAGVVQPVTFGNAAQISGFHQTGANIICDVAGKYRVTALISQLVGGTASNYTVVTIVVYTAGGAQRTSSQFVGGFVPANAYHGSTVADGEWDLAVGEYIQVTVQPNAATTLESRSYVTITPVGGAKGDKGDPGNAITVGGKPWQVLTKRSTIDGDAIWRTPPVGPQSSICWRYPALLSSWVNYGNPFTGARYGRRNSVIYLQGLVSRAANLTSPNANLFGIDKGYTPGAPGTTGQNVLQWVPAQNGAQLARLDFLSYSPGPPNGQGMVVTSDQTGGTGTNAGWMSISNVSAPLDGMNGIEQGFEITVNADGSVYIAGGAMWIAGVRYEVPPGVVGTVLNPGGSVRLVAVFPYMGSLNDIRYGMIDGTNEESARSMAFSSYYWGYDGVGTSYPWPSIATRTSGVWADRREWV